LPVLWDKIFQTPEIVERVAGEKLIIKYLFTDFDTDFYIDITGEIPNYFWDPETDLPVVPIQASERVSPGPVTPIPC